MKQKIIELIEQNRISTTEVADVLGKLGCIAGISALNTGMHRVGECRFIFASNESNWMTHEQIRSLDERKIVFAMGFNCKERAIFGDLVCKYLLLYKHSIGIIVDGKVRDAHTLIKERYPIWCRGVTPVGCFNEQNAQMPAEDLLRGYRERFDGAIIVADDSGVVVIEKAQINEALYQRLQLIELQEDVWYFAMDAHKMSTYDIVCKKEYLQREGLIHKDLLEELSRFSEKIEQKKDE